LRFLYPLKFSAHLKNLLHRTYERGYLFFLQKGNLVRKMFEQSPSQKILVVQKGHVEKKTCVWSIDLGLFCAHFYARTDVCVCMCAFVDRDRQTCKQSLSLSHTHSLTFSLLLLSLLSTHTHKLSLSLSLSLAFSHIMILLRHHTIMSP